MSNNFYVCPYLHKLYINTYYSTLSICQPALITPHAYTRIRLHTHMHTYAHMYTHICIRTQVYASHAHFYTHKHTHIRTDVLGVVRNLIALSDRIAVPYSPGRSLLI